MLILTLKMEQQVGIIRAASDWAGACLLTEVFAQSATSQAGPHLLPCNMLSAQTRTADPAVAMPRAFVPSSGKAILMITIP